MALNPRLKALFEHELANAKASLIEYEKGFELSHRDGNAPSYSVVEERMAELRGTIQTLETILARNAD